MAIVLITPPAQRKFERLPLPIMGRVQRIFERLTDWPKVSGAKPMRGELAGHYRVRTGDYRVLFTVSGDTVTVTAIGHRDGVYDD